MWNIVTWVWDLEKIWVLIRFEQMTFRTLGGYSIHWATRTHGEPGHLHVTEFLDHMRLRSCLLQDSAVNMSVVNNDKWVMVKLQLGKYMWNNVKRAWDLENIRVVIGPEPMTFWTPGGRSIHWATCTRTHGEPGHLTEFLHDMLHHVCTTQQCNSEWRHDWSLHLYKM